MQTTVLKIKLRKLNSGKACRLAELSAEFTECVRFHWERISKLETTNTVEIHRDCYREARERFRLPASTIQQARDKAVAAYRSYLSRRKKDRRAKPPTFKRELPLRLAAENIRVFADRSMVRVSTLDGFLWLPIIIPGVFSSAIRDKVGVSEILRKGKNLFVMLTVKTPDVPVNDGDQPHFGLDLGLAQLAVLSGPGLVKFFDGKPLRYVRGRYFRYRRALQEKRKVGMVKRSKGRESRWVTNHNHKVSRAIIEILVKHNGILHVEKLAGIRERARSTKKINRMLSGWPFGQLLDFIKYKAAIYGVRVIEEDPRHTSQMCSRCGHTERGNRNKQAFKCKACGFEIHADLNAARNLSAKGVDSLGVGDVTEPLNGEYGVGRKACAVDNRNLESS